MHPYTRIDPWKAPQGCIGPYAADDALVDLKLSARPKEECVRRTVTVRYGELDIAVSCYIEPAEPEIGLNSPAVYIEEIELPHVDNIYVADFVYDRYDKDQMFAMWLQDAVERELREQTRQRMEDAA